ncbi:MAG: winged helix-turn-helix domain-containing tetratricopeptide repeat protein, partial [Lysobacterales bacterium]
MSKRLLFASNGQPVPLTPKAFDTLLCLLQNRAEVLTKEKLIQAVWPGRVVEENNLNQNISTLRRALGESQGDHRYIVTVPGRGYRFVAEVKTATGHPAIVAVNAIVRPIEPETIASLEPVEPGATEARDHSRHHVAWAIAALLAIGVTWAVFEWRNTAENQSASNPLQSIAVLPFLPLTVEQSEPELELGMADTLIARLSRLDQIVVRPIAMVRGFGAMDRDSLVAGKALGVAAVVEGSIQRSDGLIRVTVRLLRVTDGKALWAGTFDEPFSDIFAMQDDICARISDALALHLGPEEQKNLARGGTSQTEAYLLYLKGRFHLVPLTAPEMRTAIDYFRQAVALDPDYAQAWLGLANVQFRMPLAGEAPPKEFFPQAKAAALRALEIDDQLAEGYAYLGWIAFWYEWDWASAESLFQHALSLNPNDFESHLGYAHLLSNTGRHEAALGEVRRARELAPFSPIASMLEAGFLATAGRPEEALERLEEDQEIIKGFWVARLT